MLMAPVSLPMGLPTTTTCGTGGGTHHRSTKLMSLNTSTAGPPSSSLSSSSSSSASPSSISLSTPPKEPLVLPPIAVQIQQATDVIMAVRQLRHDREVEKKKKKRCQQQDGSDRLDLRHRSPPSANNVGRATTVAAATATATITKESFTSYPSSSQSSPPRYHYHSPRDDRSADAVDSLLVHHVVADNKYRELQDKHGKVVLERDELLRLCDDQQAAMDRLVIEHQTVVQELERECDLWRVAVEERIFDALENDDDYDDNNDKKNEEDNNNDDKNDKNNNKKDDDSKDDYGLDKDGSTSPPFPIHHGDGGTTTSTATTSTSTMTTFTTDGGVVAGHGTNPNTNTITTEITALQIKAAKKDAAMGSLRAKFQTMGHLLLHHEKEVEVDATPIKFEKQEHEQEQEIITLRAQVETLKDLLASQGTMYEARLKDESTKTQIAKDALDRTQRKMSTLEGLLLGLQTTVGMLMASTTIAVVPDDMEEQTSTKS